MKNKWPVGAIFVLFGNIPIAAGVFAILNGRTSDGIATVACGLIVQGIGIGLIVIESCHHNPL